MQFKLEDLTREFCDYLFVPWRIHFDRIMAASESHWEQVAKWHAAAKESQTRKRVLIGSDLGTASDLACVDFDQVPLYVPPDKAEFDGQRLMWRTVRDRMFGVIDATSDWLDYVFVTHHPGIFAEKWAGGPYVADPNIVESKFRKNVLVLCLAETQAEFDGKHYVLVKSLADKVPQVGFVLCPSDDLLVGVPDRWAACDVRDGITWFFLADPGRPLNTHYLLELIRQIRDGGAWYWSDLDRSTKLYKKVAGATTSAWGVPGAVDVKISDAPIEFGEKDPPQPRLYTPYGYCPTCGGPGTMRERRMNGNDVCGAGHEYPSKDARRLPLATIK